MLSIFNLIGNGSKYAVQSDLDKTLDCLVQKGEEEYHLIVPNSVLIGRSSLVRLFEKYHFQELFELSNCYLGSHNEPYMYWHISKRKSEKIKIAIFYGHAHPYRDDTFLEGKRSVPDRFNDGYKKYISVLEGWLKTNKKPTDSKKGCEFKEIYAGEFDYTKPYARFYRSANDELRKLLRTAKIVPLNEIADTILVTVLNGGRDVIKVKTLNANKAPTYPYIPELQAIEGISSTEKVHKGDIVELGFREFFLIDKESEFELYAPAGRHIIRSRTVCPEYLYLYLSSPTAQKIKRAYEVPCGDHIFTNMFGPLGNFPVVMPKEDEAIYKNRFLKLSSLDERIYFSQDKSSKPETIEQALTLDWIERIKLHHEELIKKQIEEDIAEINICYSNRAYKATLIMAGSIMEALLIDWLSEIRGVNYFEKKLCKREYDKKNKCYIKNSKGEYIYNNREADLADYIDEIEEIKRPEWMEEAKKAHKIRKKRNLVHAKLCLKESADINDDTCKKVIEYLKNIIDSRWK